VTRTEKSDGARSRKRGVLAFINGEALRRRTIALLDIGLSHCGLVHRERRTRRDSIKREACFIKGSSAIDVGELASQLV